MRSVVVLGHSNARGSKGYPLFPANFACGSRCARGRAHLRRDFEDTPQAFDSSWRAAQTAHYAICTGFMALGMMIPGMWSGWLQELIGYQHFFVWVILATIPSFIVVLLIPLDKEFGKKA